MLIRSQCYVTSVNKRSNLENKKGKHQDTVGGKGEIIKLSDLPG